MTLTKERFDQGLTYADYKAHMTRNRDRLEANEQAVEFDDADLAFFQQLPQPLYVLVLAEDWCGDVIAHLPVLGRLAAESGKLILRVFPRDQHLDLMALYLKQGQFQSIPVFAFFDQDFNEIGHWIERPARVSEMMDQLRQDLFKHDPAFATIAPDTAFAQLPEEARMRLGQAFATFREEHRTFADHEVVRELRALIAHGLNLADTPAPESASTPVVPVSVGGRKQKRAVKVRITYCAECGYEPQTLALTSALMQEFVHDLGSIELIPWQDGAFEVVVDDDLVHSMYRDGGFPEHAAMIRAVREHLAA